MLPRYLAVHLAATALLITRAEARQPQLSPVWRDRVTHEVERLRTAWRPSSKWVQTAGPHRVTPGATGT